ncbi:MAG TPA: fused MFS/spermidine synthase [Candidatus Latescibacteria bacterium]|jgi:spermidine synthase|nr:fused MFS/spermidine synthase [Candidatus Latescibacterota bacterium]HJP29575.1 fused MFS/spermidine synthase [Candidatus Latescibacterota bacterium]
MSRRLTIFVLFFLSGALGLLYEITWMRQFRIIMGNTVHTSATVLTAFMGGLALGSFLAGRVVDRVRRPLRAYGVLELLVGAYALLLPVLMLPADPLYGWLYRHFADQAGVLSLGRFLLSSALLLPPATMMGATLPLLTRYLAEGLQWVGRDVGRLYGVNTIGAAMGAAAAGFAFVPLGGVQGTLWMGAGGSIAIGLLSLAIDRQRESPPLAGAEPDPSMAREPLQTAVVVGLAIAGAASMIYEVAWTRTLTQLIGSSVYAFTLMLVAFIAGLGLGAVVLAGFIDRRRNPVLLLGVLQVVVAVACLAIVPLFGIAPPLVVELVTSWAGTFATLHAVQFVTVFLLMLVPTFAMGGVFPTVARIYARDLKAIGRSVGEAYAANTIGSVIGSFVAGFVLIPWIGVRNSILLAVVLNALLGAVFWWVSGWGTTRRRALCIGVAGVALVGATAAMPGWDTYLLNSAPYLYAYRYKAKAVTRGVDLGQVMSKRRRLLYEEEGLTATVTVVESGGELYLKVNGKTDASSRGDLRSQSLLSHLPALLHPDPQQTLLIGLGSGISLGALEQHPVTSIECVEISPEVVHAARLFQEANGDALADERVRLIIGDGRNHTAHVAASFDVIISQPSNLWIAGMADLFTVEFFQACRSKLAPGGIMCSWIQAYSMTSADFRTIVRTFARVFPHVTLWESVPGGDYFLVGGEGPIHLSLANLLERAEMRELRSDLERIGVHTVEQILSSYVAADDALRGFAAAGRLNTDDNATLEFSAPHGQAAGLIAGPGLFGPHELDDIRTPTPTQFLTDVGDHVPEALVSTWKARSAARAVTAHLNAGRQSAALRAIESAARLNPLDMEVRRLFPELAATAGSALEQQGELQAAEALYSRSLTAQPDDVRLLLRRATIRQRRGLFEEADNDLRQALIVNPGSVGVRLQLASLAAQRGRTDEAETQYRTAAKDFQEDSRAFNEWGKYLLRGERWEEAIAVFARGLEYHPRSAQLANNLGVGWIQVGDLGAAASWFRRAVEEQPTYTRAWINLGDATARLGHLEAARQAYRQALMREPGNPRAQRGMQQL